MSQQNPKLGLGNSLDDQVEIIHSNLNGRRSFGRVADLFIAWTETKQQRSGFELSSLRLQMQALFELAYPKGKKQSGYFEYAITDKAYFMSVRFGHASSSTEVEKNISQFWVEDEKCRLLKKFLGRNDRIEVRFHQKLNLIEWRVVFFGERSAEQLGEEPGFQVFVDSSDKLESTHSKYTEAGDLPYQKLLHEAYRSASVAGKSGELYFQGQAVQGEEETSRVVTEKEKEEIAQEAIALAKSERAKKAGKVEFEPMMLDEEDIEEIRFAADQEVAEAEAQLLKDGKPPLSDEAKELIRLAKHRELVAQREAMAIQLRVDKLEEALDRKEAARLQLQSQMRVLNEKITKLQAAANQGGNAKAFRDKAIEMHTMLKKVKDENSALLKQLKASQNKQDEMEAEKLEREAAGAAGGHTLQVEELTKRQERTQRALDAEKVKVKQLSERVTQAEKEAAAASAVKTDLENKMEQANRLAAQHRKDLENQKQKLVQLEGEKGKLQAEINKLKVEVQALQKKQAA